MRTPITVGVVGLGRWGIELARAFDDSPLAEVRWACDERPTRPRLRSLHSLTHDLGDLLADETLDAVAFATPPSTRCRLVRQALEADKHVYVEGPLGSHSSETLELIRLAKAGNRRLMIGNALLFDPGVRKLKELIDLGRLGEIYYLTATLTTTEQAGEGATIVNDDAGRAVATILHLLGDEPISAWSKQDAYVHADGAEVAVSHLRFATGIAATVHVSWLDAREQCQIAAIGSKRTAVFDAADPARKVTVYDKRSPRGAEIVCPRIAAGDPVHLQCEAFLGGVRAAGDFPSTRLAPAVVQVLESCAGDRPEAAPVKTGRARLRLALPEPSPN